MSIKRPRTAWGVVAGVVICIGLGWSILNAQQDQTPAVETLLPANAVLYFGMDGVDAHRETWVKTAEYQALYESGLADALEKLVSSFGAAAGPQANDARRAWETISSKGLSFAVALPAEAGAMPLPYATIVLHEGAKFEPGLADLISATAGQQAVFAPKESHGRKMTSGTIPVSPGMEVEIAWWTEGKHLVAAVGFGAVEATLAVVTGEKPNLTTNELWKKYHDQKPAFEMTSLFWFDFGSLRTRFGEMPIPSPEKPVKINQVLTALGLEKVGALVSQTGYKGKAQWVETVLEAPGPRTGLLALASEKPISLADLPPLPFGHSGFYAASVDWSKVYDVLVQMARDISAFGPPDAAAQIDGMIEAAPGMLGFEPKKDLLDPLGNVICAYGDSRQGILLTGMGIAIKVDDAKTLQGTTNKLLSQLSVSSRPDQVAVTRAQKQGREIVTVEIGGGAVNPSFAISDNWLVLGVIPQTVEAFFLRVDKKLTVWEPTKLYQEAFDALPKSFQSIGTSDPRKMYRTLVGLAPAILPAVQAGMRQSGLPILPPSMSGFSAADLPPAELVGRPLFPNVAVCTADDAGIHWTSRSSLPAIPFLDSGGGGTLATAAIATALILPAVQQARAAARRAASSNNMKQIMLALHNYHDANNSFPRGTHETKDLEVDKRLSWMAEILPFLEQNAIHQQLKFDKAWDDESNKGTAEIDIPTFQNPNMAAPNTVGFGTTHYVGMGGFGEEGPTLPVTDKKAGVFGYDRVTKITDIADGTSNTIAISEVSGDIGAWAAGGKPTIRALTKKPYINGPDGLGGQSAGGCNMGLSDGSVRFVSENIDPSVLEKLVTINGGESIGGF